MLKKTLILISIIQLLIITGSASLLVENLYTTIPGLPVHISSSSIWLSGTPEAYWNNIGTRGTDSLMVINAQSIKVEDSWDLVSSLSFYMKRQATCLNPCNNDPNLYLKIWKSPTTSFADAILWDTGIYNPANTGNFQQYTFAFDADIPVYNQYDIKIIQSLWITLQQAPIASDFSQTDSTRYIQVVFSDTPDDKYPDGILYQSISNGPYTEFNYPINVNYAADYYRTDLAFKLYGTFHIPQTPVPPPVIPGGGNQTVMLPEGCSLEDFYNGLCSNIPDNFFIGGGTQYNPDYNYSENNTLLNSSILAKCSDESGSNSPCLSNTDNAAGSLLSGLGYCTSSGCTSEDVFDLLYDMAEILMVISFLYVGWVWYKFTFKSKR
jgi:hypothetical protein